MTRFEASVVMFMVMAIMLILLFGVISIISTLNDIKQQHENIKDAVLDDSKGIPALVDIVDKMHRNMSAIMAEKMVEQHYPIEKGKTLDSPFQPPFNPTCGTTNNSEDVYVECRRMAAINTASVCENMTKIQKELQKKGGQDGN